MANNAESEALVGPGIVELRRAVEGLGAEVRALRELAVRTPADVPERIVRFRETRVLRVLQAETPVPLGPGPCLVLHVLPRTAFEDAPSALDLAAAQFLIFGSGGSPTFDANGKLFWPEDWRKPEQRGYAHMTGSGCIEAVERVGENLNAAQPERLRVLRAEGLIVDGAREYLNSLTKLGVAGEITIAATLVRVRGLIALVRSDYDTPRLAIPDDVVPMPAVRVNSAVHEQDLNKALRPALDVLWRVGGLPRCQHYDAEGNYRR
jgi:hypothetical protein